MKHTLLLTALSASLLASTHSNAQVPGVSKVTKSFPKVDLGVQVGANFQTLTGDNWKNNYSGGLVAGAYVGLHKNKWGGKMEVLVKTVKYNVDLTNAEIKTVNLDVPLLLEYRIVPRLWVQLGPQYTNMISAKQNGDDVKNDFFKSSELSGVIGLEAHLPLHINVGARYVMGFTDQNNTSASDAWKNRAIQGFVGFRIL